MGFLAHPASNVEYFFSYAIAFYFIVPTFASTIGYGMNISIFFVSIADVAKLVDALDLGSSAARHGGSSPSIRTKYRTLNHSTVFNHRKGIGGF